MFSNHINQFVHLKEPEFPKVFTNFEDQVGEYSVAYKRAEESFKIISKIVKNEFNYDLIIQYKKSGIYDIIHYNRCKNITEDYGYSLQDCLSECDHGDTVEKGQFIYKSDNYDEDGNFSYGRNLFAAYVPWNNMTYEDGVVISKSAAEKFTSYKVEKTMFSVNDNDILINLYGDSENYKSFPKIGEHTTGKVLIASRRRDRRTSLYDFQSSRMQVLDPVNDDIIYTNGGVVVDIDVYSNKRLEEMRNGANVFTQEIIDVAENNYRYWKELATELEKIIPCKTLTESEIQQERNEFGCVIRHPLEREKNVNQYTDELSYYWKLSHEYIDDRIQWRYDGKQFENFRIMFTILKENPLTPGCKITRTLKFLGVLKVF